MIKDFFDFIESSPSAAHTVAAIKERLLKQGFQEISENERWELEEGGRYFTTRNRTSILAFKFPGKKFNAFSIVAPHSDSPNFKVKTAPEIRVNEAYTRLNTEVYGGMQLGLWLDRPLSVAGKLAVAAENGIETVLTDIKRDLLVIPSLAIHLNREVNKGIELNPQNDTLPLFGGSEADLLELAAQSAGVKKEAVVFYDLYLYNRMRGCVFGADNEFIAAPKLDDLECVYTSLSAFLEAENESNCMVLAVFDNEEIGSLTRQGADSTFLYDCISRICLISGKDEEERIMAIQGGFMLSADNAHALHPNYPQKSDSTNKCLLNGGVVIKHSTRYTTEAFTAAVFKKLCDRAGVLTQTYFNNSRLPGGSTLGNISGSHISIPAVDIGLAQLAMHSPYESAGARDIKYMTEAVKYFYKSRIVMLKDGEAEFL